MIFLFAQHPTVESLNTKQAPMFIYSAVVQSSARDPAVPSNQATREEIRLWQEKDFNTRGFVQLFKTAACIKLYVSVLREKKPKRNPLRINKT